MSNKAPTKLAEHLHVLQEPMWMAKYTLVLQEFNNSLKIPYLGIKEGNVRGDLYIYKELDLNSKKY